MKMENFKDSVIVEAQQDSLLYDYSMECWPYDETSIEFMEAWKEIYECTPDSITPVMVYKYELDAVVIKLADIQRQNTILALSILVIIALVALVGYIIYRRVKGKMKKEEFAKRLLQQQAATLPIFADKERIEQVVTNIIGNAIKYTPDGGKISVNVSENDGGEYVLSVTDTGVGIPEEDLEHIFERFYRVDKSRSTDAGGTGLGLSIAKDIIDAHGGTISIDSEYGKGTTVTIVLPKDSRLSKEV